MKLPPFKTEAFYAQYEFSAPHLLSVSDCETLSISQLLELAGRALEELAGLELGYTESQGKPSLRAAIASTYTGVLAEDVLVLATPIEGIYIGMRALLEPDDEVIALLPAYDALKTLPEVAAQLKLWNLKAEESGWALDWDALDALITDKTKLIVVNFPHNPTGFLPTPTEFSRLVTLARSQGIWLFSDEMYRGLEFGAAPQLASACEVYEKSVVLAGLSKTHGLPGLRAGWLVIRDEALRAAVLNWKLYTSICAPAPVEFLAEVALSIGATLAQRSKQLVRANLELAEAFFARYSNLFAWRPPLAGSVALVGVKVGSAEAYCHRLAREAGVVLLPSSCLGYGDKHVRFGFGRASFASALAAYEKVLGEKDSLV